MREFRAGQRTLPDSRGSERGHKTGRLIFLGTGDPLNEERAQTCLAVPLAGRETMMDDASSGTVLLRQLAASGIALEGIRHLFVTHRHFDHVGGLAPLLIALAAVPDASLTIHATPATLGALHELLALTIPGVEDWVGERLRWSTLTPGEAVGAGDAEVTPFEVDHGLECVGFRIDRDGAAMTFAADTRPCENAIRYAKGADLLVHEAYGPESDAEQAHAFGHSTAAEAGRTAREARAKRLILTHFRASRFIVPGELAAEARAAFGGPVEVARDFETFEF